MTAVAMLPATVAPLALVPLVLLAIACTLKSGVVLSLLGRGVGGRALPGAVVAGVAILLAAFVLSPIVAADGTPAPDGVRTYLESHTKQADREQLAALHPGAANEKDLGVMLPAYALSELRVAFQIGFYLLLPFLVLDLLVAMALLGLGVHTLETRVVSLPLKLLLFVSIDGWTLVQRALLGTA